MAPRTRTMKKVAGKEVVEKAQMVPKKKAAGGSGKKSTAGPSKPEALPRRKLIIRDSSDETSSEDDVPLVRRRARLTAAVPAIDLNASPAVQGEAQDASVEAEEARAEQFEDELNSEMEKEAEEERERERLKKLEEDKRIDEEVNRWAEEFEEEMERDEQEEQERMAEAQRVEVPRAVPAGTVVANSAEAECSNAVLEASRVRKPRTPRVRAAIVPAALRSPKKKRPAQEQPNLGAEPSAKKKKPVVVDLEEDLWIENWMINSEAAKRYEYIGYKDFEQEQGFQLREQESFIKEKLEHHQWLQLAGLEEPVRPEMVYQFYSNLNLGEAYTSKVRGKVIRWDAGAWNELLRLPHNSDTDFSLISAEPTEKNLDDCLQTIGGPGAFWAVKGKTVQMGARFLNAEAQCWMNFIRTTLMPTTHKFNTTRTRCLLAYCIMEKKSVNVGEILEAEILKCEHKKEGKLFFPHLITMLCLRQGASPDSEDQLIMPRQPYMTPEQRSRAIRGAQGVGIRGGIEEVLAEVRELKDLQIHQHNQARKFWDYVRQRDEVMQKYMEFTSGFLQFPAFPAGLSNPWEPASPAQADRHQEDSASSPQF